MTRVRLLLMVTFLTGVIAGCVGTVKHEMTTEFPAAVHYALDTPLPLDGRARFRQILCRVMAADTGGQQAGDACDSVLWRFNDEPSPGTAPPVSIDRVPPYRVLIVPGFLGDCFAHIASPFEEAMSALNALGYRIERLAISGRSGSALNAAEMAAAIDSMDLGKDEKIILVGHSKGAVDILYCLVNYPKVCRHIAAVVSVAGAINGSPLADHLEDAYQDMARHILHRKCEPGDDLALNSLRPSLRLSWLAANPLPQSVRYFSIAAVTTREHMNTFLKNGYDLLAIYSPRNDGLMLMCDQIVPGSTFLGIANADHWSVVLPLESKKFPISNTVQAPFVFPRKAMLQAVLIYVAEALEN